MCVCTPAIRTPWCGAPGCERPAMPPSPPRVELPAGDPLPGISAEELLERAVRSARDRRHRKGQAHWRWVAVMDAFALGSTYAQMLCRLFGLDPDEMVKR